MQKYADAEKSYLKAIELKPNYVEAYYYLGFACFAQKKFTLSARAYSKAV